MSDFEARQFAVKIGVRLGRALALGAFLFATIFSFGPPANTQSERAIRKTRSPRPEFIPGELLVRFRSEAEAEREQKDGRLQIEGREAHISIERLDAADILEGLRFVHVSSEETLKAIEALSARPDVLYAEPNYVRERFGAPNDPLYSNLWALHNTGSIFGNAGFPPGLDIDAEQAWNITTGSRSIVVGVVDGGIDVNHPDLHDNIWINTNEVPGNGVDDDGNGYVDDINGFDFFHNQGNVFDPGNYDVEAHATHVAGTIGAVGNNGIGVVGVNWQVSLMSLKIFGRPGESPYPSSVRLLVRAYAYAKKMRDLWISSGGTKGANIRVLNNSIGGYGRSKT